jgi:hypothetical protein
MTEAKYPAKKMKYFLPYRLSFSNENLARVRKTIQTRQKVNSLRNPKFDNFTALAGSTTKYRFLSDQVVKDFQLEKDLFLHFTSPLVNVQPKNPEIKTFKQ